MHIKAFSICAATTFVLYSTLVSAVPMQSDASTQDVTRSLSVQFPSSSLSYLAQEPSQLAFPHDRVSITAIA